METYTEGIQASANTKRQHIIKEEQGKMSWIWIMIMTLKKMEKINYDTSMLQMPD